MELENRIAPAGYGTAGTIDNSLSIPSLADGDVVTVEIASATSFDTFVVEDGQLAGNLKLVLDGYTPTVGDSFEVLTSSQPSQSLAGNFAAYEGLGFFHGLYLKPVVQGDTLSLEVAEIPGGQLATTVLDVAASFAGGTISLSVESPGVFDFTVEGMNLNFPGGSNSLVSVDNAGGTLVLDTNTGGLAGSLAGDVAVNFTGVNFTGTVTLDFNTSDDPLNGLDPHFLQLAGQDVELDISAGSIDVNLTGDFTFTK